jgi:hypothetical protein
LSVKHTYIYCTYVLHRQHVSTHHRVIIRPLYTITITKDLYLYIGAWWWLYDESKHVACVVRKYNKYRCVWLTITWYYYFVFLSWALCPYSTPAHPQLRSLLLLWMSSSWMTLLHTQPTIICASEIFEICLKFFYVLCKKWLYVGEIVTALHMLYLQSHKTGINGI